MEDFEKQISIFAISFLIGLALVLTGVTEGIHYNVKELTQPMFVNYNEEKAPLVAESIAYGIEISIAALLMFTPLSAMSSAWFFKIAYDLVVGKGAGTNVFVIDPVLNYVMAIICITLLVYSLYNQYSWTVKLIQPGTKATDDELEKLI